MAAHVRAMLALRRSSPLFRLRTAADIEKRIDFPSPYAGPDQTPGLLVMTVSDGTCAGTSLDGARSGFVVIVNAGPTAQDVTIPGITFLYLPLTTPARTSPTVPLGMISVAIPRS